MTECLITLQQSNKKNTINIKSIAKAVKDGRLSVFVDGNGAVIIKNTNTKNAISIYPTIDMNDCDKDICVIDQIWSN